MIVAHYRGAADGCVERMDIIFIRELRVETVIGVFAWERQIHQTLTLDLDMGHDGRAAARDDDLALAVNYKAVADRIAQFAAECRCQLVETFAERVAALVQQEFGVIWLRLTVQKVGAVSAARSVGVVIERGLRA
jgi:7,8-dihydroneopterin aldolase/epimerase/oxygenase